MTPYLIWESVVVFLEAGGPVLSVIFCVTLLMWTLMLERLWYVAFVHRRHSGAVAKEWAASEYRSHQHGEQIRRLLVSQASHRLERSMPMIKTLVAVCPLLGLLGTVTGMIEVFDVMAIAGNANARAMASGVSRATIPTMAGMVAALSGLLISVPLQKFADREKQRMDDLLVLAEG